MNPHELIQQAQTGDQSALTRVLLDHKNIVAAVVSRFVWDKEQRRDVAQNIFAAVIRVGRDDRLQVMAVNGAMFQIRTSDGRHGWVEQRMVADVGRVNRFEFEGNTITDYRNNPQMFSIFGDSDGRDGPFSLQRSFAANLRENVDRETIARGTGTAN
jgi:hypothetical protein